MTMEQSRVKVDRSRRSALGHCTTLCLLKQLLSDIDELRILQYEQFVGAHTFLPSEQQEQIVFKICDSQMQQRLSATLESIFCIRIGFGTTFREGDEQTRILSPIDTRFDAVQMYRSLSCDACYLPISMQTAEVYAPLKQMFAKIEQDFNLFYGEFSVKDALGNTIFRIMGKDIKQTEYEIELKKQTVIGTISLGDGQGKPAVIGYSKFLDEDQKLLILASALFIICM